MTPTSFPTENDGIETIDEHPETLLSDDEPEPVYGDRNQKLPTQLVEALKSLVKEAQLQEIYARRREVIRDRTNRFYERGFQHVYADQNGFFFQAIAGQASPVDNGSDCPQYIGDFNIYNRFLEILIAILTQNSPGVEFQPINPNLAEDNEAAQTGDSYAKMFYRSNSVKSLQKKLVRMFGLSSRAIIWTRTEANAQKFGTNEDGSPKKMEVASIYGTLESKVPITAKCQEEMMYCFLYDDPDIKRAKAENPDFADKIKPNIGGLGENVYERNARLGILQGTRTWAQMGDAFNHLCTRMNCWLRPENFTAEICQKDFEEPESDDYNEDGSVITVEDKLRQLFPFGVHAVFIGDVYVGSWAESMDDAITVGFPYEGDGMFRQALMDAVNIVQDVFNDCMNAARQAFDEGWPSNWVDAEQIEYEAIRNQVADPYAYRQLKGAAGQPLSDKFYREPDPELPESFINFLQMNFGELPQFQLATPPAVFGEAMSDQKTASGYSQARAQAMGQQGTVWGEMQRMFAQMLYQAAIAASRNPDHSEEITIPGGKNESQITIRLERITKGKFGAFPDQDSSFPESTAQKRAALNGVLQQAALAPAIAMQINESPRNWKTYAALQGFSELHIPAADSWEKQTFEIEELLQTKPIPPSVPELQAAQQQHATQVLQTGVATPFDPRSLDKPSVEAERYDFHEWEFNACKDWLSSAACRREIAQKNYDGVRNVRLHAAQHEMWMKILAPPPMPFNAPKGPQPARPAPPPPPPPVNPAPVNIPATM